MDPIVTAPAEPDATVREAVRLCAKTQDPGRYLAALLSPAEVRADLFALTAFSGEVARIPHIVTEPLIGEIRLQWWRDALPALVKGEPTGNPVADALGSAMRTHALPQGLVLGVLDACAFDLYRDPMPDEQTFKAYLGKTEGALLELALRIVAGWPPGTAASAVVAAGQAVGLARVLTGLPQLLARGRCPLPATRLQAAGITSADLAATPLGEPARSVIAGVVGEARTALAVVAARWRHIPRRQRTALLPVALVEPQLRAFDSVTHHPGRDLAAIMPLSRVWRIWCADTFGRI